MDRIAVIADVHGNIPALEAVFEDIKKHGADRVLCLGDLAGKGPEPAVSVDMCRDSCETVVLGNWDKMLADREYPLPSRPDDIVEIVEWHRDHLGPSRLAYLNNLPGSVEFVMSGRNVRLFHASQIGISHRVHFRDPIEKHMAMFDNTDFTGSKQVPHIVGYADIHFAFKAQYGERTLFNVGSVGNPLDQPLASWALIEGEHGVREREPISVEIMRVPYNIDLALQRARDSGMPEYREWETELRTARYRGLPPLQSAS